MPGETSGETSVKTCRAQLRRHDRREVSAADMKKERAAPDRQRAPLVLTLRAADGAPSPACPLLSKGREGILFTYVTRAARVLA
jgi:hypothetical protein